MLLQIKVYMIAVIYLFGALFIILFPPRNYEKSGEMTKRVRRMGGKLQFMEYVNQKVLAISASRMNKEDSDIVRIVHLSPHTIENNSIIALELHSDLNSKKPGILVIGTLNAMTWATPNAILELAEKLLYDTNYQTPFFNDYDWYDTVNTWIKNTATRLLFKWHSHIMIIKYTSLDKKWISSGILQSIKHDGATWFRKFYSLPIYSFRYLIPLANPDGLNFSHSLRFRPPLDTAEWSRNITARDKSRPREWYKNIDKETGQDICFGTNVNRNFAYHWQDDVHKTPDRCSQYYPGTKPFSTAEAQAIRIYIHKLADRVNLAIYLHASFVPKKECIIYPWRYSSRQPSNYRSLQAIGEYAARHSRLPNGRLYEVQQASHDEKVAGSLIDYISGVVGTELVFVIKPYHQLFPNFTNSIILETYVNKGISAILSIVRGWRSSTKQNTLSFFGKDVEF